ncbi:MAG TPA: ATP-binding protein [Acidobacteriota bacterium]|nr:ATP-binding protein [Acidobacteriota bacterium]
MTKYEDITKNVQDGLESIRKYIAHPNAAQGLQQLAMPKAAVYQSAYALVNKELANGTRITVPQVQILDVYEQALGIFQQSTQTLRKNMDVGSLELRLTATHDQTTQDKPSATRADYVTSVQLANKYALAFAGHVGLSMLNRPLSATNDIYAFDADMSFSRDDETLTQNLVKQTQADMTKWFAKVRADGEKPSDEALKDVLAYTFTSWINQFRWSTHKDVAKARDIEGLTLKYDRFTIKDGAFSTKDNRVEIDERVMRLMPDDIIGNAKMKADVQQWLLKIALYDHSVAKNVEKVPMCTYIDGPPGCGKTVFANAHLQWIAQMCKDAQIPCWVGIHSATDYISHYQNQSAVELDKFAAKIRGFPGIVVQYIADVDTIFGNRASGMTQEEQKIFSTYLKMFDGSSIPKIGKVGFIMDANYSDGIDKATKSRIFGQTFVMSPLATPQEFADYSKLSLTKGLPIDMPQQQWLHLGEYLKSIELNNRQIGHVFDDIRSGNMVVSPEMLTWSFDKKLKFRLDSIGELSAEKIIAKFDAYLKTLAAMDARQQDEKAKQVEKMLAEQEKMRSFLAMKIGEQAKTL